MKILSKEDNNKLHREYFASSDVYRDMQQPLTELMEACGTPSPTDVWYQTELVLDHLRSCLPYQAAEVPRVYSTLLDDARRLEYADGRVMPMADIQARLITDLVLMVVCIRLENVHDTDLHPDERTKSDEVPYAILSMMKRDPFSMKLLDHLMGEDTDFFGNEKVFTDFDPLKAEAHGVELPSEKSRRERLCDLVEERTCGLKTLLHDHWQQWLTLWQDILGYQTMAEKLTKPVPRKWPMGEGISAKMVCNVLGFFCQGMNLNIPATTLNKAITTTNLASYIRNHDCCKNGAPNSDSVLSREECEKIKVSINKLKQTDYQSDRK